MTILVNKSQLIWCHISPLTPMIIVYSHSVYTFGMQAYVCMYVCMHVCMYACMHVCIYVFIYVCTPARTHARTHALSLYMHACAYTQTRTTHVHSCLREYMHLHACVRLHACLRACVRVRKNYSYINYKRFYLAIR